MIRKYEFVVGFLKCEFLSLSHEQLFLQVQEVQLAVEEQELQKHAVVKRKFEEMSKLEARIKDLEEQLEGKETVSQDLEKSRQELTGEWLYTFP